FARPGPQIGFLQEALRWWDHWLKGIDGGLMREPMLRAWISDSVRPASDHEELPGRWVAASAWPPPGIVPQRLVLADDGLRSGDCSLSPRAVRSPLTLGSEAGQWCPFGRGDLAGDQRPDDARSLCFDSAPLGAPMELLGAPMVVLDLACDR